MVTEVIGGSSGVTIGGPPDKPKTGSDTRFWLRRLKRKTIPPLGKAHGLIGCQITTDSLEGFDTQYYVVGKLK